MKSLISISIFILFIFGALLQGCGGEKCLCEPESNINTEWYTQADSIILDERLSRMLGPRPGPEMDSFIRLSYASVWDTARTIRTLKKTGTGYSLEKKLMPLSSSYQDKPYRSESRPVSNTQWTSVVVSFEKNCFFEKPMIIDKRVLHGGQETIEANFPDRICGLNFHRTFRRTGDSIDHIRDALYNAEIYRPFGTHQIDPIID